MVPDPDLLPLTEVDLDRSAATVQVDLLPRAEERDSAEMVDPAGPADVTGDDLEAVRYRHLDFSPGVEIGTRRLEDMRLREHLLDRRGPSHGGLVQDAERQDVEAALSRVLTPVDRAAESPTACRPPR